MSVISEFLASRRKLSLEVSLLLVHLPGAAFLSLTFKPSGDEFCFVSNFYRLGLWNSFFENFNINPFVLTALIGTGQGVAYSIFGDLAFFATGLVFYLLLFQTSRMLFQYILHDRLLSYLLACAMPYFLLLALSEDTTLPNFGATTYLSGWIVSFIHLISVLAAIALLLMPHDSYGFIQGRGLSLAILIILATNFGFISSSFALLVVLVKSLLSLSKQNIHSDVFFVCILPVALAALPMLIAFFSGAAGTRYLAATGQSFDFVSSIERSIQSIPSYLVQGTTNIFEQLVVWKLLLFFTFGLFFSSGKGKKTTDGKQVLGLGFLVLISPIVLSFLISFWESQSYYAWWHYPVLTIVVYMSLMFLGICFGSVDIDFFPKVLIIFVICLFSIGKYSAEFSAVISKSEAWKSGVSYSHSGLADLGVDWVDKCATFIPDLDKAPNQ